MRGGSGQRPGSVSAPAQAAGVEAVEAAQLAQMAGQAPQIPLRREKLAGRTTLLDYWHPTALGHMVAAREIASQLACAGALPETNAVLCRAEVGRDR